MTQIPASPQRRTQSAVAPKTYTRERLPSQVFTRGSSGAVKVHRGSVNIRTTPPDKSARRRSRSQDRGQRRERSPPNPNRRQSTNTTRYQYDSQQARPSRSRDSNDHRYLQHPDSSSDQGSAASSSPSFGRGGRSEMREPPIVKTPVKRDLSYELSPNKSMDSQTQHIKTAKRVVDDLNRAQGPDRRIAAITNACEILDHADELKHNVELQAGAAQALVKLLAVTNEPNEIRMLCSALEMVFRGSLRQVQATFKAIPNGMPLLVRLLMYWENAGFRHSDVSVLNISRTILYFSRCNELRVSLCRQQGLLDALIRVSTAVLTPDCRLVRIRIAANLAMCEDNKVLMFEKEGLLESIMRMAHLDLSEQARQYAGAALADLSSATANQSAMANDEKLLGTLVKMILVEKSAVTRELALTSLQNLAFARENRGRLVSYKNGIVLEALRKALASDADAKARKRAAGALTNLACDETGEKIGNHKGLLDTLAIVSTKDESADVQTRASLALTKVASSITVKMECHETLLDALVVASLSTAPNSTSAVLRTKARAPENRESMARHPGVLDTLTDICVSAGAQTKDRDNALRAIMHLVNEKRNHKIMCSKAVLDALVDGANYDEKDLREARYSAIRALERLATEFSNRAQMARHYGLLITVAKAVEREAKEDDAGKESEHGYLAKPLLMSLLLAM